MNSTHSIDAGAIRRARAERRRAIRRRVIAGALALFVAVWLWIAVVLVTGHDPALAHQSASAGSAGQTSTAAAQTSTTTAQTSTTTGQTSTTAQSGTGSGASGVTTRQS